MTHRNVEFCEVKPDQCLVTLNYPRNDGHVTKIEIDLCDVRAADGIRVKYDFDRDGWVIEQARYFSWDADDPVCDPGWTEVAFVRAWGSRVEEDD